MFLEMHSEDSGFGGFGGSHGRNSQRVNRGSDLRVKVSLTLLEIATGVEKKIKVKKYVPCTHCKDVPGLRTDHHFQPAAPATEVVM